MSDPVLKAITEARLHMLFHQPFFGMLALRLKIVEASKWCPTAATDGRHLFFNREFVKNLKQPELVFLIAHEVMHCAFDHLGRRGKRQPVYWNAANDYVVNYTLVKQNVGKMINGGLYSEQYTDAMSSDEIYNLLMKQFPDAQKNAKNKDGSSAELSGDGSEIDMDSLPKELRTADQHLELSKDKKKNKDQQGEESDLDDGIVTDRNKGYKDPNGNPDPGNKTGDNDFSDGPPSLTEEDLAEIRNDMKVALIGAVQSNKGNAPACMQRLIDDLTDPKLDWNQILEEQIQSYVRDDFSFTRLSKKSWAANCMLPGNSYGNSLRVAVSIDTSGSISDAMVRMFLTEVKSIMECFDDYEVHIWCIDSVVYEDTYKIFTPANVDELMSYKARGGGGNDFPANWHFMKERELEPEIFVVFSDGYPCGSWGEENYCDTIFVIKNQWDKNIQAPFGLTLYMDDEGTPDE